MTSPFPPQLQGLTLDLLSFVIGMCVGSFLNVLALRSLAEQSIIFPASHCPRCKHPLGIFDNIPVLSWLLLRGKCRYCSGPIHWQYPVVEAFTGFTFLAIEKVFFDLQHSPFNTVWWNQILASFLDGNMPAAALNWHVDTEAERSIVVGWIINPAQQLLSGWRFLPGFANSWNQQDLLLLAAGAIFFACVLIAVSVTDFREKLIPHDITYPAMIVGILFSAFVRHDLLGAMAGIGASYILFDFIAFYGLKVYLMSHGGTPEARPRRLRRRFPPRTRRRLSRSLRWRLDLATIENSEQEEPVEVMGGGDAVLSAVMSAFLGWQLLVISLVFGFIIGTAMGLFLLIDEMRKANLLHICAKRAAICAAVGATVLGCFAWFMTRDISSTGGLSMPLGMALVGAVSGLLIGVVSIGTRVSKPYPFGPALAAGGFIAIFLLPNWVYLSAIAPMPH
ncbi:MAG TPA: prepilin peptidase [Candidatus Obscuribacterales bacterium]